MTIIFDGTLGITSPGGDTSNTSHSTPIVKSPSALTLQTNGSTRAMTIDTSQNVLIGSELTSGSSKLMVSNTLNYTHINNGNSTVNGSVPWLATFNNANASSATFGWALYDSNADGSLNIYKRNSSTTGDHVMRMDRNIGAVTIPNQPRFQAGDSALGSVTSGSILVLNEYVYNPTNNYNTTNGRFTAPIAGFYQFNFCIRFDSVPSSISFIRIRPLRNNAHIEYYAGDAIFGSNMGGVNYLHSAMAFGISLNSGDYVTLEFSTGGGYSSSCFGGFSGYLVA
jgi:hypothetical protein